jgi:hypothetical protein
MTPDQIAVSIVLVLFVCMMTPLLLAARFNALDFQRRKKQYAADRLRAEVFANALRARLIRESQERAAQNSPDPVAPSSLPAHNPLRRRMLPLRPNHG